jgi:holo-[acyl-carrier protein] synthase
VSDQSPRLALMSVWNASTGSSLGVWGAGIDLVEIAALSDLLNAGGTAFVDAGWTTGEQVDCGGVPERLAGRWAAKEAIMKALGHGIGELEPKDVEIETSVEGAPIVVLHLGALELANALGIGEWHLSITHEGGWAAAIAIASPKCP